MFRSLFLGILILAACQNVLGQLPGGRVWQVYPVNANGVLPPLIKIYQKPGTPTVPVPQGPTVIDLIKRETGEAAWEGENFGLIGSDGQKLYVYHTPAVQQRVGEVVGRLLRTETRNIQFDVQLRCLTFSQNILKDLLKNGNGIFGAFRRIQPVLTPDGKPMSQTPGSEVYWVAKDDIPDFENESARLIGRTHGDTQSNTLQCPVLTTFDGQFGVFMDGTPSEFVTNFIQGQPVKTTYIEGMTITAFSLLSWDGKTVTTDISAEFAKIQKIEERTIIGIFHEQTDQTIRVPELTKTNLDNKNIVWASDGMLVIVYGFNRLSEGRLEKKKWQLPFSNQPVGRIEQTIYCITTVKMRDLAKEPLTPAKAVQ